jgi:hypothetical protein
MKNTMAIVALLLGCQVMTCAAALAYGDNDKSIDALLQAPLQKIAQGDMSTMDSAYVAPDSGDGAAETTDPPGAKAKRKRANHGAAAYKRKHAPKGKYKRRLSSGMRSGSQAVSGSTGNTCCASPSSGM